MIKNKQPKQRNYVVKKMIERSQKAGYHLDVKKDYEKYLCRQEISEEDMENYDDDGYKDSE